MSKHTDEMELSKDAEHMTASVTETHGGGQLTNHGLVHAQETDRPREDFYEEIYEGEAQGDNRFINVLTLLSLASFILWLSQSYALRDFVHEVWRLVEKFVMPRFQ